MNRLGGGVALLVLENEDQQAGDGDGTVRDVLEGEVGGEEAVVGVLYGPVAVRGRQDAHPVEGGLDALDLDGVAHAEVLLGWGSGGPFVLPLFGRLPVFRGRRFVGGGWRGVRLVAAHEGEAHYGADACQDEQDGGEAQDQGQRPAVVAIRHSRRCVGRRGHLLGGGALLQRGRHAGAAHPAEVAPRGDDASAPRAVNRVFPTGHLP